MNNLLRRHHYLKRYSQEVKGNKYREDYLKSKLNQHYYLWRSMLRSIYNHTPLIILLWTICSKFPSTRKIMDLLQLILILNNTRLRPELKQTSKRTIKLAKRSEPLWLIVIKNGYHHTRHNWVLEEMFKRITNTNQ